MAGIFGLFDYTRPGPGVPKDAPPKARIVVFFEILGRKFWNLIKINIMFNIFNIPATILGILAVLWVTSSETEKIADPTAALVDLIVKFSFTTIVLCIPVVTVGPAQAGFTYILRNYSREEHAFIWGDFKEQAIKNFKQSSIVSIIDFLVFVFMIFAMRFYFLYNGGLITSVAAGLMLIAFILFIMMHMYIYPMLVTFELTIKQLYRNAFLFSFLKFFSNLGILLLCAFILMLTFGQIIIYISPVIGLILYGFISVSLIGLITNFYVYPKLKKYIMDKVEPADEEYEEEDFEESDEDNNEEESVFSDERKDD